MMRIGELLSVVRGCCPKCSDTLDATAFAARFGVGLGAPRLSCTAPWLPVRTSEATTRAHLTTSV